MEKPIGHWNIHCCGWIMTSSGRLHPKWWLERGTATTRTSMRFLHRFSFQSYNRRQIRAHVPPHMSVGAMWCNHPVDRILTHIDQIFNIWYDFDGFGDGSISVSPHFGSPGLPKIPGPRWRDPTIAGWRYDWQQPWIDFFVSDHILRDMI